MILMHWLHVRCDCNSTAVSTRVRLRSTALRLFNDYVTTVRSTCVGWCTAA